MYRKTPESRDGRILLLGLLGNNVMIVPRMEISVGTRFSLIFETVNSLASEEEFTDV
jgi:hypothetical protein